LRRTPLAILFTVTLLLANCGQPSARDVYPGETWHWAKSPEELGWSAEKLAVARAYSRRIGSAAVIIVDDGVVIDAWGDVTRNYMCHSVRKGLLSALYGIYVAEGEIDLSKTLQELGIDDYARLTQTEKQATVADLLKARSGVYIPAVGETAEMKAARPARGSHPPGTFWYYNNWDFNALGTIFDQETGEKNIYQAFKTRIADPIGMQDYSIEHLRYDYEPTSVHPYYGFLVSARDLARFGLLFARGGRWEDEQIIPRSWVVASTTSYSDAGPNGGYGYMWWIAVDGTHVPNVVLPDGSFSAQGYRGQFLLVIPQRGIVIVHRFDTFAPTGQVDGASFGYLVRLILQAGPEELDLGIPHLAESIALDETELGRYVGRYSLTETEGSPAPSKVIVELRDGNLVLVAQGQLTVILVPVAPSRFRLASGGAYYVDFRMGGDDVEAAIVEIDGIVMAEYRPST
jgi:CubicO group peptidase (beta-lactamase class C family)